MQKAMNPLASQISHSLPQICIDLSTFQPLNTYYHIQTGEIEAIQTLLIKIYSTRFKNSFQCFDIRLKCIIINAMLEILPWKPVTATSSFYIVQKLIKSAFEIRSYLLEMSSDSGLQHTEIAFNEVDRKETV